MRGGGVERGAGRGAQKEARDKVTRMDEGSERKWNRWRRGRKEEGAGEHVEGDREGPSGRGAASAWRRSPRWPRGSAEEPDRGPGGVERVIIE